MPNQKPMTAEERAKALVIKLDEGFFPFNMEQKARANLIAAELEAYAEEKVDKMADRVVLWHHYNSDGTQDVLSDEAVSVMKQARAEAFEECAKICEDHINERELDPMQNWTCETLAAIIRSRGDK